MTECTSTKTFFMTAVATVALQILPAVATAELGVTDKEILIGRSSILSGPTQASGKSLSLGGKLYFDRINTSGGVHGRKIKVVEYDDKYEPAECIKNTEKLLEEDKVFALFNYIGIPTVKAVMPLVFKSNRLFLFPRVGESFVREPFDRKVFSIKPSFSDEMETVIEELVTKRGKTRIAMLTQDDAMGGATRSGALKALHKHGIKSFVIEKTIQRNTEDNEAIYKAIADANAEAVIMGAASGSSIPFMKFVAAQKKDWILATPTVNVALMSVAQELDLHLLIALFVPDPELSKLPIADEFRKAWEKAKEPGLVPMTAFEGYVNAAVLVEGLKRTGADLTKDNFIKAMESAPINVGGIKFNFGATNHGGDGRIYLREIHKKKIIDL